MDFDWLSSIYGYGTSNVNLQWYEYMLEQQKTQGTDFLKLIEEKLSEAGISTQAEGSEKTASEVEASLAVRETAADEAKGQAVSVQNKVSAGSRLTRSDPSLILHGAQEGTGETRVSAWADTATGTSVSVYKPADFDAGNPVYKVKVWEADGTQTEKMVDLSNIDVKNCDTLEMYAYSAYLADSGIYENALQKFMAARAGSLGMNGMYGGNPAGSSNWLEIVRGLAQSQYEKGNLAAYLEWNRFVKVLNGES